MAELDLFTQNLNSNNSKWKTDSLNDKNWLIVNSKNSNGNNTKVRYFIITTIPNNKTDTIKNVINMSPKDFKLSDNGHVSWSSTEYVLNKFNTTNDLNTAKSIYELTKLIPNIYYYDENKVISSNLKYILYLDSSVNKYKVLYNPLHRTQFKEYYKSIMNDSSLNWTFGATPTLSYNIFPNACNSFIVNEENYLDPTCNLFLYKDICEASAFFADNKIWEKRGLILNDQTKEFLKKIGQDCVYGGPFSPDKYANSYPAPDSFSVGKDIGEPPHSYFANKINPNPPDNLTFNTEICKTINASTGTETATTNNKFYNKCVAEGYIKPSGSPPSSSTPPSSSPSSGSPPPSSTPPSRSPSSSSPPSRSPSSGSPPSRSPSSSSPPSSSPSSAPPSRSPSSGSPPSSSPSSGSQKPDNMETLIKKHLPIVIGAGVGIIILIMLILILLL